MTEKTDRRDRLVVTLFGCQCAGAAPSARVTASPSTGILEALSFFRTTPGAVAALILLVEIAGESALDAAIASCQALLSALPAQGVFITLSAQDLARTEVNIDLVYEDFGVLSADAASRNERIYAVLHPDLPEPELPILRLAGNCPRPQRSFIGRHAEIARLEELVGDRKLVAIIGPPGVGKSSLAMRVVRGMTEEVKDGVWWFSVADCVSGEDLMARIREADGLCGAIGSVNAQSLAEGIAAKEAVVVLDGCDRLLAEVASFCKALLQLSSKLTVVVTATHPLNITGEQLLCLAPLSLGNESTVPNEYALFESEALDMLYERAGEAGVVLPFDDLTVSHALTLCRLVDGLPLAIEMLASALRQTSFSELIEALDDAGRSLPPSAAFAREERAFEAAFLPLPSGERDLLSHLALFAGGWTLAVAEQVIAIDEVANSQVRSLHQSLYENSWLTYDAEQRVYKMLAPLRGFVLRRGGSVSKAGHMAGLLRLLEETVPSVYHTNQLGHEVLLTRHYPDFILALQWAMEVESLQSYVAPLMQHLIPYWSRRNLLDDAWRFGREATRLVSGRDLLRVHNLLGIVAFRRRSYEEATEAFTAAGTASRQADFKLGEASALCNLAMVKSGAGDHAEAASLYEQGIQSFRLCGDERRLASALTNAANAALLAAISTVESQRLAHIDRARDLLNAVRELRADDPGVLQAAHHNRGRIALLVGETKSAESEFRRAIAVCEDNHLSHEAFEAVVGLAQVAVRTNQTETAAKLIGLAKSILHTSGHAPSDELTADIGGLLSVFRTELGLLRCEKLMRYGSRLELGEIKKYALSR